MADEHDSKEILRQKNRLLELENERLHERLRELSTQIDALEGRQAPEQLALELKSLTEQMQGLQKKVFGDSSEKREYDSPPKESSTPRSTSGRTPQKSLPHIDTLVEIADDDRECPACSGTLSEMKGQTEDNEVIDIVQRKFVVRRIQRQKYRCKCQAAIVVAPPSIMHRPRGRYTLDLECYTSVRKYGWGEPLDRLRRSMLADGLKITTQTLWDQCEHIASLVEPLYQAIREHILASDVIGVDETWWRLMDRSAKKRWWIWAMQSKDAVFFKAAPSRSADTAMELLGDFEGTIICDAYKAYETAAKKRGLVKLALCWAHVRRKFVEAEPNYPACARALDLIGALFAIDSDSDDPTLLSGAAKTHASETRLRLRTEMAPPILEELREWALEQRGLPKSSLRKAIDYMLGHWGPLQAFLEDPFVPLDNNATERALRGIVIGRKNHYGSRSERGTEVAAILYTVVESARMCGLDPYAYLTGAVQGLDMGTDPRLLLPGGELFPAR